MTAHRAFLTVASVLALFVAPAPALAAPDNGNTFSLDLACSDGHDYDITLLETSSDPAAVHIVGTSSVLVPTAFQWHVVVTDAEGSVLDETTSPPEAVHGRSVDRLHTVECTFTQVAHHDNPDTGSLTITIDGTVWAYLPR